MFQVKDLLHRQDILEKSHRQQLIMEVKKKKEVKKQLAATEERVKTLESMVMEKDKLINRLHIYSRRQGERGAPTTMRGSVGPDELLSFLQLVFPGEHEQPELHPPAQAGHQPPLPRLRPGATNKQTI